MATRINPTRTLRREVPSLHHGPLILTITEEGIYYREKRRRTAFLLPHGVAFQNAVSLHVRRERAEKNATRKLKPKRGKL